MNWDCHPGEAHQELNYVVSEAKAQAVRNYLMGCVLMGVVYFDEWCVGQPNWSYSVHTIYLDSDDLTLYWRANGDPEHRMELRIRYHDLAPGSPAWLEIKRRLSDVVLRERCAVRIELIPRWLSGEAPLADLLTSQATKDLQASMKFKELVETLRVKPRLHVAYQRECYVDATNVVRVSMDRHIVCEPCLGPELGLRMKSPRCLFDSGVLLELNYGRRCPNWFLDLVEHFNLTSCGADKYLEGMDALLSV